MKILTRIAGCIECPYRRYASCGVYECTQTQVHLVEGETVPMWCPLPDDPTAKLATQIKHLMDCNKNLADQLKSAKASRPGEKP